MVKAEMAPVTKEQALKSALASSAMEGFPVTPEVTRNCQRLLNGEWDVNDLVDSVLKRASNTIDSEAPNPKA